MPRLNQLEQVLFSVARHPIYARIPGSNGSREIRVPDRDALVDERTDRVVGVVSKGYRLVLNAEALEMGWKCCRTVFPQTKESEWEVNVVDAPSTASYCHFDLIHNSAALAFSFTGATGKPEGFGPFVRVTNSYNGQRALAFDVGLMRKVCSNGLVVPESFIKFRFTHRRQDIGATIEFQVDRDRLSRLTESFTRNLGVLHECRVPRDSFDTFVRGVLCLREPAKLEPESREAAEWGRLTSHVGELADRYAGELGETAYAVFNVVTDFSSHPPANRYVHRDRHGFQRLAGAWLSTFCRRCREPSFNLPAYLADLKNPPNGAKGDVSLAVSRRPS